MMKDVLTMRDKIVYKIRDSCSTLCFKKSVFPEGVSFLVVVKDREDTILKCLLSILPIADEVIVVDSTVKDSTGSVVKGLMPHFKTIKYFYYPYVPHGVWGAFVDALNFGLNQCRFRWVFKWDGDLIGITEGVQLWLQKARIESKGHFCMVDVARVTDGVLSSFEGRLYTQTKSVRYKLVSNNGALAGDQIVFPMWFKLMRFPDAYIIHQSMVKEK